MFYLKLYFYFLFIILFAYIKFYLIFSYNYEFTSKNRKNVFLESRNRNLV